jgi:hypothetical protein
MRGSCGSGFVKIGHLWIRACEVVALVDQGSVREVELENQGLLVCDTSGSEFGRRCGTFESR